MPNRTGKCHKLCSIPPDLERLDKLCHCMEDEIHFLCVCPAYCNLRDELYIIIYNLYIQVSDTSPLQINYTASISMAYKPPRLLLVQVLLLLYYELTLFTFSKGCNFYLVIANTKLELQMSYKTKRKQKEGKQTGHSQISLIPRIFRLSMK